MQQSVLLNTRIIHICRMICWIFGPLITFLYEIPDLIYRNQITPILVTAFLSGLGSCPEPISCLDVTVVAGIQSCRQQNTLHLEKISNYIWNPHFFKCLSLNNRGSWKPMVSCNKNQQVGKPHWTNLQKNPCKFMTRGFWAPFLATMCWWRVIRWPKRIRLSLFIPAYILHTCFVKKNVQSDSDASRMKVLHLFPAELVSPQKNFPPGYR